MDTLKEYINTHDYDMGVRLYQELIGEDSLYQLLVKRQNTFTESKLLTKLTEKYESIQQGNKKEGKVKGNTVPVEIFKLREKAQELMNERAELKANLRIQYFRKLDEPQNRSKQVFRIKAIRSELDRVFEVLNYYNLKGVLLPTANVEVEDPRKELLNLRTYVTKYTKALSDKETLRGKRMTTSDIEKYKSKLSEYSRNLEKLTKEIEQNIYIHEEEDRT